MKTIIKERKFKVIRARIGEITEIEKFTESQMLAQPIHPFIKECIKRPDFDHLQIAYFVDSTTIQVGE